MSKWDQSGQLVVCTGSWLVGERHEVVDHVVSAWRLALEMRDGQ